MERAILVVVLFACFAGCVHGALKAACNATTLCDGAFFCDQGTCRGKIGGACTTLSSTDECVRNFTCVAAPSGGSGNVCQNGCPPATHVPNVAMTACAARIGQTCANAVECIGGAGNMSMCSSMKCACATNYVADYDMGMCKKAAGQACPAGSTCGQNSVCNATTTVCDCSSGFMAHGGRCSKMVDGTCTADSDCGLMAMCSTATPKKCTCKSGYVTDTATQFCKESGARAIFGSVLTVLALFVTSQLL